MDQQDLPALVRMLQAWAAELGFAQLGISDLELDTAGAHLRQWLARGFHGDMAYMERHGSKRWRPQELVPQTLRVVSVRMNYWPEHLTRPPAHVNAPEHAYVSRYALGRDYHKLMRRRLQKLCERLAEHIGDFGYRCFVDSAPVLEKAIAEKAGLGWIGKHSNLVHPRAGSYFFLGEIYTDLALPLSDAPIEDHCGRCTRCIDVCPTQAIVGPYQVDARRCISYLTIEHHGSIPESLRPLMGNHVYGCDDCQTVCPWNRFSVRTPEEDFWPRHALDASTLLALFAWTPQQFERRTEGSAIRRIGYQRWRRNLAVALGNAPVPHADIDRALSEADREDQLVAEHIDWAIAQRSFRATATNN